MPCKAIVRNGLTESSARAVESLVLSFPDLSIKTVYYRYSRQRKNKSTRRVSNCINLSIVRFAIAIEI